jgi:hypothetical protein
MGEQLHLGAPTVIESYADKTPYGAVFEDDGKLAYFYAVDTRLGEPAVLDSVCVYHITAVVNHPTPELDAFHPYDMRVVWSEDQQHVALLLDGYAHAAFDFENRRAYCLAISRLDRPGVRPATHGTSTRWIFSMRCRRAWRSRRLGCRECRKSGLGIRASAVQER